MLVCERMTRDPVVVERIHTLSEVMYTMVAGGVHRVPVVEDSEDGRRVVGIITERDVRTAALSLMAELVDPRVNVESPTLAHPIPYEAAFPDRRKRPPPRPAPAPRALEPTAQDIMTTNVISLRGDALFDEAVELMLAHHVGGLPVLDKRGHLIGIITRGDLYRVLLELRRAAPQGNRRSSASDHAALPQESAHRRGPEPQPWDGLQMKEAFRTVVSQLLPLMQFESMSALMVNAENACYEVFVMGPRDAGVRRLKLPVEEAPTAWKIATDPPFLVVSSPEGRQNLEHVPCAPDGTHSALTVPLLLDGCAVGTLHACSSVFHNFSDASVVLMRHAASQLMETHRACARVAAGGVAARPLIEVPPSAGAECSPDSLPCTTSFSAWEAATRGHCSSSH